MMKNEMKCLMQFSIFELQKKTTRQAELNEIHIEIINDDEELRKKGD